MNPSESLEAIKQNFLSQKNTEGFAIKEALPVWFGLNDLLNSSGESAPSVLEALTNQTFPANSALEAFQNEVALSMSDRIKSIFHKYLHLSPKSEEQANAQQAMFEMHRQPLCRVLVSEEKNGEVLVRAQAVTSVFKGNVSPDIQKMGLSIRFGETPDSPIGDLALRLEEFEQQVEYMAHQSAINGVAIEPEFNHKQFDRDYAHNEQLENQAILVNPFLNTQGQRLKLRDLPISSVFETKEIPNVWLALSQYQDKTGELVPIVSTSNVLDSIVSQEQFKLPKHPAQVHFSVLTAQQFVEDLKRSVYSHLRDFYLNKDALTQQVQTKVSHNHELTVGENQTPKDFNGTFSIRLLDENQQEIGQKTITFDFKETDSTQTIWEKRMQAFNQAVGSANELGREYDALSKKPQSAPASVGVDVRETDPFVPKLSDMYNL